jgi:ArsR family metal-binding transcriptional regulator
MEVFFLLFNMDIAIAFKNIKDQYEIEEFSLFEIEKVNKKFPSHEVKISKNKEMIIKVGCPLCGEKHYYKYNLCELLKREMTIGGCEILGMPVFYIGAKEKIEQRVNKYREINRQLFEMI